MRSSEVIIKSSLEKIQKANPAFSMRALAKKLEMSPGFLSKAINGKRVFPAEKIESLCHFLQVDNITRSELELSIALGAIDNKYQEQVLKKYSEAKANGSRFEELGTGDYWILEKWYRWMVFFLLQVQHFQENPQLIADEIGVKQKTVDETIIGLVEKGFIVQRAFHYEPTKKSIRFPATRVHPVSRSINDDMLQLARKELNEKRTQEDFDRRMMTFLTFSANEEKMKEFRDRYRRFVFGLIDEMCGEDTRESHPHDVVYQVSYQIFPVTKKIAKDQKKDLSA